MYHEFIFFYQIYHKLNKRFNISDKVLWKDEDYDEGVEDQVYLVPQNY